MRRIVFLKTLLFIFLLFWAGNAAIAGTIDPDGDDHKYAWGENIGWINFNPALGSGVTVTDTDIKGEAWGENTGWIVFDPSYGGVFNDGYGNLSGCAWGENVGWISFSCNTIDCDSVDYGVYIDPHTGMFSGKAWGENVGWISFEYADADMHGVKTSWRSTATCYGDVDAPYGDGDVDGLDLAVLATQGQWDLTAFAANYGRTDCHE